MDKKENPFNMINPSAICGDGSCGCGCGVPTETGEDLSHKENQEAGASSKDRFLDIPAASREKPVE